MNPTWFWWYERGDKIVFCETFNHFSNGQEVAVDGMGWVRIYRPAVDGFSPIPPFYPTNVVDQGTQYLSLGDGNSHVDMQFWLQIFSDYDGRADVRQLIKRSASNGAHSDSTQGYFWLDSYRFYLAGSDDPGTPFPVRAGRPATLNFSDSPAYQEQWALTGFTTTVSDQFQVYVMFRPDAGNPADNIYVSLGMTTWSWSASSTYSFSGGWSAPAGTVTPPAGPDESDDFPSWPNTYRNTGH